MFCQYCDAKTIDDQTCQDLYDKLALYTLNHYEPEFFIHQYAVDAYAASHMQDGQKPIKAAFALTGLYLFSERGYTGKEVQQAHRWLVPTVKQSRIRDRIGTNESGIKRWPMFKKPEIKPEMNVESAVKAIAGQQRDQMIKNWAEAVWQSHSINRQDVINFLGKTGLKYLN